MATGLRVGWTPPPPDGEVEEVARHVGHMDVIREQLDGVKGYY
jgi:hypothetical protein